MVEITARSLRSGDVIVGRPGAATAKRLHVTTVTKWNKSATYNSSIHHRGCRGVHVNGMHCYEADTPLLVSRIN